MLLSAMMYCMPFPSSKSGNISFCFKRNWLEDISSGTVYAKEKSERERERGKENFISFGVLEKHSFFGWPDSAPLVQHKHRPGRQADHLSITMSLILIGRRTCRWVIGRRVAMKQSWDLFWDYLDASQLYVGNKSHMWVSIQSPLHRCCCEFMNHKFFISLYIHSF